MASRARGLVLCALAALALAACQTPRQIRDAQSAFDEAARAEYADRAAARDSAALLLASSSAAGGYRIALGLAQRELAEHQADLRRDGLLGTALLLRALCLWRIADLDADPAARTQLDAALADLQERTADPSSGVALGARDRALLAALPGLRDHDIGLRQAAYADARRYFASALAVYDRALAAPGLPANHPVRSYLLLAKLASLRAWKYAAFEPQAGLSDEQRDRLESALLDCARAAAHELDAIGGGDAALASLVRGYASALGFSTPVSGDERCALGADT